MINVLVPISNDSRFFPESEYLYPKTLTEVSGRLMIDLVIESLRGLGSDLRFIFTVQRQDAERFHYENILDLLTQGQCELVLLDGPTKGAACSCLMAVEHIDNCEPLIISNCDQLIEGDLAMILQELQARDLDAGVVSFDSVHPKWSYVTLDGDGLVREAAEKRPISRHALTGLYYFREGRVFVEAAMAMIRKDAQVNGAFYIAPVLNELVLAGRRVGMTTIDASRYHNFFSPQRIAEYEALRAGRGR